ncbi:MAG: methyltransferase domain-containing protein [Thermofilaceae archaeon]|nr:methyltransferase domain-containing protein [Thermofilaceae archaeon]MCX8180231.1 methyltransferase domain-containing protein [Thermofilaceae archaeon]
MASSSKPTKLSVNLGRDRLEAQVKDDTIILDHRFKISAVRLKQALREKDTTVFFLDETGKFYKIAFYRGERYYKLRNVGENLAPTLEISGVHMHNILGTDPWVDARRKVEAINVKKHEKVLDLCTGLGYTASIAALRGATVVTIEKDPAVLEIAEYNPWSYMLSNSNVSIILGDATEIIEDFPSGVFDAAIHDPPRLRLAGELYSLEFYKKLRRVLRRGGLLFHYTGWPGKHQGLNIQVGIARRLRAANYSILQVFKGYGIVAQAL